MYSERIILQKLAKFRAKYGWTPTPHTIEEVEKATEYIKSQYRRDSKGDPYFDDESWTPKLVRFVQNERALCAMDCSYFLTRYYKIAANSLVQRFTFRSGQRVFYSICQELEEQGKPIEIQTLKARQQGISTLVEGMVTHRALFSPGTKCSVASADAQKTQVMMGMMYMAMNHIPWWLSPTQTKNNRSSKPMIEFEHVGTQIVIQSGTMKGGIGQGTTPTVIHLSEVCDYTNPVMQIEEGLLRAVHPDPNIFMVLESTGNGNTGWWADQWRSNKEFYFQGKARLYPLFLPWFMTPELYPTPTWTKDHPVPDSFASQRVPETLTMAAKCEMYARATPILRKYLGENWTMPLEQQWFWEFNFLDHRRRRIEKSWLRQMPCDDFEALIGEKDSVFGFDTIEMIAKERKRKVEVYGLIGEDIKEKHEPPPMLIDSCRDPIHIAWKTPKETNLEWFLLPYADENTERKEFDPLKKFLIFEHPIKGVEYSIGVDTGTGVGKDRSIISINRKGVGEDSDVQVAEFAADDITNVEIYTYVAAIAAYYGRFMDEGRTPKLIIEQRRKYGDTCQHQLNLMGMRRHHEFVTYDKKTLKPKGREGSRLGWFTNDWSRPMLLGMFKYAIEGGWYRVNSRFLLEEIEAFKQDHTSSGKTRMDHENGEHDDRIFAAAMSYFTMHDLETMIERANKKFNKPKEEDYSVDYEPFHYTVNVGGEDFFYGESGR